MIRAFLIALIALFSLGFTPVAHADDDEGDIVVWGN
jgi:hypothetical protein